MKRRMLKQLCTVVCGLLLVASFGLASAQSRHEKRQEKLEESSKAKSVAGGVTFQVDMAYAAAYDAALDYLKRHDYTIDSASKESGQMVTAIVIAGHWSQTGTRVYLSILRDNDRQSTIKVAVSEQKRKKMLQTEPWGDPKVKTDKSRELADAIAAVLRSS